MTKTASKTTKPTTAATNSQTITIADDGSRTQARFMADLLTDGVVLNATASNNMVRTILPGVPATETYESLNDLGAAVNRGDLSSAERLLAAQAVTLNATFAELLTRAMLNMGSHLEATETYMRLALRAQNQTRATLETLAAIKNPPVVFARQMNVAHGPQQVNNGKPPQAIAQAEETESPKTKLLQGEVPNVLDTRAPTKAGRGNKAVEAVGAVNRAAKRKG